jgi:hypothetical protein
VAAKSLRLQSVGNRDRRDGNSCRNAAGSSFEAIDDLGDAKRRVGFDKQVNVIRHDLDGMKPHAVFGGDLGEQRLEPRINRLRQDRATVFRAPHDVMLQRKHHAGVLCVSIPHERSIYIYAYSFQLPGIALARDPAFRCRLKATVPSRRT